MPPSLFEILRAIPDQAAQATPIPFRVPGGLCQRQPLEIEYRAHYPFSVALPPISARENFSASPTSNAAPESPGRP